jgi:hypothetical protein
VKIVTFETSTGSVTVRPAADEDEATVSIQLNDDGEVWLPPDEARELANYLIQMANKAEWLHKAAKKAQGRV